MKKDYSITKKFGVDLAKILSEKIAKVYPKFASQAYIQFIKKESLGKTYTQRVDLHAVALNKYLPAKYDQALKILMKILGEENPAQTGMFTNYYWLLPVGKFVEKYGLDNFDISIQAIAEITKRNTGEYAIRSFIKEYPNQTLLIMQEWSKSENFHLRRLASEGLRPKLPWATKLDIYIENPEPVFRLLDNLKADEIKFVQKSVANHLTDYLKVNPLPTKKLLKKWSKSKNKNTQWIIKYATRKIEL